MVQRRTLLGAVAGGIATGLAGCALPGRRGDHSYFTYLLSLEPAERVENVQLYVPIPVQGGTAVLTELVGELTEWQPDWGVEIVDTERGPMLEVSIEELSPPGGPYDVWIDLPVDEEIDTRDALEHSPTLQPKDGLQQVECDFPYPDRWEDRLRCYTFESALYSDYAGGTVVSVYVSLGGWNEWFDGGWTGNDYDDTVTGTVTGEGWTTASGRFWEGRGRY